MYELVQRVSGTEKPIQGAADKTVIAAPGIGKRIYVRSVAIAVTVAAAAAGGEVALEDGVGGTRFIEIDADAVGAWYFEFNEPGYPLSLNTLLNATVDGSSGNQASARVTVTGYAL